MGRLELRVDGTSVGYHVDGEPVHAGQELQILLEGDLWVTGRFDWTGEREDRPTLHVTCGGPWERMSLEGDTLPIPSEIAFQIPRDALLRPPPSRSDD